MSVIDVVKRLEKSKEFSSWRKIHHEAYLAHAFRMLDKPNESIWQIGYFNPASNLISVFVVDKDITKNEDAEVFKEQEKLVNTLDLKDMKINEDAALKKAEAVLNEKYKGMSVYKTFMILQNIEEFGTVWNITFITQQFKTVNVKIDAKSGECKQDKMVSLIAGEE